MEHSELMVAGMLVAVAALSLVASRVSVPYPIVLVIGGAALGFLPGVPSIHLDPDVVLLVFLPCCCTGPPSSRTSPTSDRDFRGLTLNAVGLVMVTMTAVAWPRTRSSRGCPGGPPSPWGRSSRRPIRWRRRPSCGASTCRGGIVSAIDGEGLFNDATALVAYRAAVAAVVAGSFSPGRVECQVRARRPGRGGDRSGRGVGLRGDQAQDRGRPDQHHDLPAHGLRGFHPSRRDRRLRGPGLRHCRHRDGDPGPQRSCPRASGCRATSSGTSSTSS